MLTTLAGKGCVELKQLLELFDGQTGIFNNTAHRVSINWISSWNDDLAVSVIHRYMFGLADHRPPSSFESTDGTQMVDTGKLGHLNSDLYFTLFYFRWIFNFGLHIILDRFLNVRQSFFFRCSL